MDQLKTLIATTQDKVGKAKTTKRKKSIEV